MTAGAAAFPGDDAVDELWIEMDAAARAPRGCPVRHQTCIVSSLSFLKERSAAGLFNMQSELLAVT